MFETPLEYERLFLTEKAPEAEPEVRISEVEKRNIPRDERDWFYVYHTTFLKTVDPQAAYALGIFYRFREPCANWYPRAIEYFHLAAPGEPRASWMLYELYRYDTRTHAADPVKSFAALLACYERYPVANLSNLIARAYLKGDGVTPDLRKARDYYGKGALQNDLAAKTALACLVRAIDEHGENADPRTVQRELMCDLFRRCGVKFRGE